MISFNNIPTDVRVPGVYVEVDNSRALQGLLANPHKALLLGQKLSSGTKAVETLYAITQDNMADGFFGAGSPLARMCNTFKYNNPNTELYAIAVSVDTGGVKASATLQTSIALSVNTFSCVGTGNLYLMINGDELIIPLTSGWSTTDVNSQIVSTINSISTLPVTASTNATSAINLIAKYSASIGNDLDVRYNYYTWQSLPCGMADSIKITGFAGGVGTPDIDTVWSLIDNEQFHYIIMPYSDATSLASVENELEDRYGPQIDKQGHGFCAYKGSTSGCTTIGNARNSAFMSIMGYYNAPQDPCEWAAALAAKASYNLNSDPARPLHGLEMRGILPPAIADRFTQTERNALLYDGIATFMVSSDGKVMIERCITTYQKNSFGISDYSYLDVETMATLSEIRYQFKVRMYNRFIAPRFKLADNNFQVQAGTYVATPNVVKQEIVALFVELNRVGLVDNIDDFVDNLVVERDLTDRSRINALLPAQLVGQFRLLAGKLQFIL